VDALQPLPFSSPPPGAEMCGFTQPALRVPMLSGPCGVLGLLVLLSVGYLNPQTPGLSRNNRYNAVFVELLGQTPVPDFYVRRIDISLYNPRRRTPGCSGATPQPKRSGARCRTGGSRCPHPCPNGRFRLRTRRIRVRLTERCHILRMAAPRSSSTVPGSPQLLKTRPHSSKALL